MKYNNYNERLAYYEAKMKYYKSKLENISGGGAGWQTKEQLLARNPETLQQTKTPQQTKIPLKIEKDIQIKQNYIKKLNSLISDKQIEINAFNIYNSKYIQNHQELTKKKSELELKISTLKKTISELETQKSTEKSRYLLAEIKKKLKIEKDNLEIEKNKLKIATDELKEIDKDEEYIRYKYNILSLAKLKEEIKMYELQIAELQLYYNK